MRTIEETTTCIYIVYLHFRNHYYALSAYTMHDG